MKSIILILIAVSLSIYQTNACNVCGGGTNDIAVLALDGRMLFNIGYTFDHYIGSWDQNGEWSDNTFNTNQQKIAAAIAYRISRHMQFGASLPYVINTSNNINLKQSGSSIGDLSISARYELFHEFQLKKSGSKKKLDKAYPYLAFTFGLTIPTGKSEETALNAVDVTGKGFYTSSLGISVIKSVIRNRFQLNADFSWQHSFSKTYETYLGSSASFTKQAGDKFNYSLSANYIFGSEHAASVSASGFSQSPYSLDNKIYDNSAEHCINFVMAYTYYPHVQFRVTPSLKWTIPTNDFGRNASGSTTFNINFTYYIPDYSIK
ncbi:MAG TPA: hypothetical protein VJ455_01850 [Ignavibacteria bacterium]|nr:hypothetical protein [Ignavibacteria bacterium]